MEVIVRSERLTIMVTPEEKATIAAKAEQLGVTSSDVVRLAVEAFGDEDVKVIQSLAETFADAMADCRRNLEAVNERVERSLAELEASRREPAVAA